MNFYSFFEVSNSKLCPFKLLVNVPQHDFRPFLLLEKEKAQLYIHYLENEVPKQLVG